MKKTIVMAGSILIAGRLGSGLLQAANNAPVVSPDSSAAPMAAPQAGQGKMDMSGAPKLVVEFNIDSYEILPTFKPNLNTFGQYLKDHPETTADIVGHADGTGHGPQNGELAQKRANAVYKYLIANYAIAANRIKALGTSATVDKMGNSTAEARQIDRRVVGSITPVKS